MILIKILRAVFVVFLCVNLFTWGTTHATGHAIPGKTDVFFGLNGIVLLGLVILFNYLHNRNKKEQNIN
jgi:predicted tellurium resistance membrane protein TerC